MRRDGGFTLLEVMVAMALLAMLGLAAALALNSGMRSQRVVSDSIDALQRLQLTQQLMRRDLEQIVVRRGRGEQGDFRAQVLEAHAGAGDDPQGVILDFYKTGRRILSRQSPGAILEHVRYRFRDGRLMRESSPLLDTPVGTRWHSVTLMEALAGVEVRFFHNGHWVDQWPPVRTTAVGETLMELPAALELSLETERYGPVAQVVLLPGVP